MSGFNPSQRRPDGVALITAAALGAVAVLIWTDAARLPQEAGYSGVGPADVPRWIAGCLAGLALWSLVAAFRDGAEVRTRQAWGPVLWIVAGLLAQLLLLIPVGFSVATGLLFAFTARGFGKRNLLVTVPVGIVFALAIYLVFAGLLKLSLPAGPLENLFLGG